MKPENRRQVIANFLEHNGPMTLRGLSDKTGIDQTTLWRDIVWMEGAELVAKDENPGWRKKGAKVGRYTYRLESAA